ARDESDNWTGKTDAKERRKLQNRLHQRAWRKAPFLGYPIPSNPHDLITQNTRSSKPVPSPSPPPPHAKPSLLIPPVIAYLPPNSPPTSAPAFKFPLSPDYYLITLIQYNVLRAILTNLSIVSLLHTVPSQCRAALNISLLPRPTSIPPSLQPTPLQLSTLHDPWIDSVPSAQLRDNLIVTREMWDEDGLCNDLLGGLYEGYDDIKEKGIIVWGEPWCERSWEVTEGFVEKWGFLLKGCGSLIGATNRWREERGEDALVVEV
ncbi:hypothetical protein K469DRAFT_564218, partial [Zopfia rhizophila CBS 207.26]